MTRAVASLTPELLEQLGDHGAHCTYWTSGQRQAPDKTAWLRRVAREWGPPGLVLLVDGAAVGHVVLAPARYLPGADQLRLAPGRRSSTTEDLLLGDFYLDPAYRGQGLGRVLIQSTASGVQLRGGGSMVAYGRQHRSENCVLPVGFLTAVGFRTERPHPIYPRMRLDLRSTVTWKDGLEQAAERLLGAVRIPASGRRPGIAPQRSSSR